MVDLKFITRESDRLRPNIWENMGEYQLQINRDEETLPNHLSFEQQLEHIVHPNYYEMATHRPVTLYCMDRGILFASAKDLHQHHALKCVCSERFVRRGIVRKFGGSRQDKTRHLFLRSTNKKH